VGWVKILRKFGAAFNEENTAMDEVVVNGVRVIATPRLDAEAVVEGWLKEYDTDKDGKINCSEFEAMNVNVDFLKVLSALKPLEGFCEANDIAAPSSAQGDLDGGKPVAVKPLTGGSTPSDTAAVPNDAPAGSQLCGTACQGTIALILLGGAAAAFKISKEK